MEDEEVGLLFTTRALLITMRFRFPQYPENSLVLGIHDEEYEGYSNLMSLPSLSYCLKNGDSRGNIEPIYPVI